MRDNDPVRDRDGRVPVADDCLSGSCGRCATCAGPDLPDASFLMREAAHEIDVLRGQMDQLRNDLAAQFVEAAGLRGQRDRLTTALQTIVEEDGRTTPMQRWEHYEAARKLLREVAND